MDGWFVCRTPFFDSWLDVLDLSGAFDVYFDYPVVCASLAYRGSASVASVAGRSSVSLLSTRSQAPTTSVRSGCVVSTDAGHASPTDGLVAEIATGFYVLLGFVFVEPALVSGFLGATGQATTTGGGVSPSQISRERFSFTIRIL